jgi:hypothetical protein
MMKGELPRKVEIMLIDPAGSYLQSAPAVQVLGGLKEVELPAYSLTRVVWE